MMRNFSIQGRSRTLPDFPCGQFAHHYKVFVLLAFAERITVENYSRFQQIKPEDLVGEWTFCDALFGPGRLT